MQFLNNWDECKIVKKENILEFEFLEENGFITEIEDNYFYLNTPFPTVEKNFFNGLNKRLADELNLENLDKEIEKFIKKINKFNEAKDVAMTLMGKLADLRNVSIKDIYQEFNLEVSGDSWK